MSGEGITIGSREQALMEQAQRVIAQRVGNDIPRFRGCSVTFELKPSHSWRVNIYHHREGSFTPQEQAQAESIVKEARTPLASIMRGEPTKHPSKAGSYKVVSRGHSWRFSQLYREIVEKASKEVAEAIPRLAGARVSPVWEYFFPQGQQIRMRIICNRTILTPERLTPKMLKRLSEKWNLSFAPQALTEEELGIAEDIFEEIVAPFLDFTGQTLHRDTERGEWEDDDEAEEETL